jgi:hypothetical protein
MPPNLTANTALDEDNQGADWTAVGPQNRIVIPSPVADRLPWIKHQPPQAVIIQLVEVGRAVVRSTADLGPLLRECRVALQAEYDANEAARLLAFSQHIFRQVTPEPRTHRLRLRPAVLKHLEVTEGDELFCLAYSGKLEIMNSAQYARLYSALNNELDLD